MKSNILVLSSLLLLLASSCGEEFDEINDEQFVGQWELTGRSAFNGMVIQIDKKGGRLTGQIVELNDNKYIQMFSEVGDLWVADISRRSNYQFSLTEKKIASQLFSMYGMSTSTKFAVEFIDKNSFGLASSGSDPLRSEIVYKRKTD